MGAVPATTNDFVGREPELHRITTLLLGSASLITLVGAGGIGKTRLATEIAHRYQRGRRVPVHWVRLARLSKGADETAVAEHVARSIIDADFSGRSTWDALVHTLFRTDAVKQRLQTVLVMDNCEHVLDGAGRLIARLLDAVPGLTVLATSREAIRWGDEQLVPVPALPRGDALALFRTRAELIGHTVAENEIDLAGSICVHLHNHPLAIRLAAARLQRQPLALILRELSGEATDGRMRWSGSMHGDIEARHHRIHDVIAWSFDLCQDKEQLLFERMSVFAAGYDAGPHDIGPSAFDVGADLDAIQQVCADPEATGTGSDARIASHEVAHLLERLADQSLVSVHLTASTVRYSLLESFRVFAQRRLRDRAGGTEWSRLAALHRRYYRDRVARAQADWFGPAELTWLDWARAAWDNLLCAMDTSVATPAEAVIGLEIATGLIALRAPFFKGSLREHRRWAERTLAATDHLANAPAALRLTAMSLMSWLSLCQGAHEDAERLLALCVSAAAERPETCATGREPNLPAPVEFVRGAHMMLVGCDPNAVAVLGRSRELFTARGDLGGAAMSELFEALAAGFFGSAGQALTIARRHFDNATASGAPWAKSWAELAWSLALTKSGAVDDALAVGRTALANQLSMRDQWGVVWAIHIRIWTLARKITDQAAPTGLSDQVGHWATEIATLAGGVAVLRRKLGVTITNLGPFGTETATALGIARKALGDNAFTASEAEGALLRLEDCEVARLALGTLSMRKLAPEHPIKQLRPSRWDELSPAEREVAALAAAGWTNTAIAAHRGSSFRTVDAQMASIFQKLMITSRTEIGSLAPGDLRSTIAAAAEHRPESHRPHGHRR